MSFLPGLSLMNSTSVHRICCASRSNEVGVASIAVPLLFNRVFFFLPIIGLIAGVRAIMRGRMIGGIVAIVLNVIGGLITILALTAG